MDQILDIKPEEAKDEKQLFKALKERLNQDTCQKDDHMGWVINEALRMFPPTLTSSPYLLTQDATIEGIKIMAGDDIVINFSGLHYNPAEW